MRGHITGQSNLFVKMNLEELVPRDHPLRAIKRMADEALSKLSRTFAAAYSDVGRPSIPPERLLKAMLLMSLYTMRSERALCERITFDMLFRWFLDMTPDEGPFDHSDFSKNRERLARLDVTKKFSDRIVMAAMDAGLISQDHFSIDGSLLQSHASLKSLKHIEKLRAEKQSAAEGKKAKGDKKDDDDKPDSNKPDSNKWVNFRGEKRSNQTHRSTTDPEARLYTKTGGVAYLQHTMHVLMENRHGIGVDIRVGKADGHAERRCCLKMLDRVKRKLGIEPVTLGADKGYDAGDFLRAVDDRAIEPHVACKSKKELDVPREDDEGGWARWFNQRRQTTRGFKTSQRKRRLDEEIFGWVKQFGGLRRSRLVGRWKIQQLADIGLSALNLIRMSKLLAA